MSRSAAITAEVRKVLKEKDVALADRVEVDIIDLLGGGRLEIVAVGEFPKSDDDEGVMPTQKELEAINEILVRTYGDSLDTQYGGKTGRIIAPPIVKYRTIPAKKIMLFTIGEPEYNFNPDGESLTIFRNLINEAMRRAGSTMSMAVGGAEPKK